MRLKCTLLSLCFALGLSLTAQYQPFSLASKHTKNKTDIFILDAKNDDIKNIHLEKSNDISISLPIGNKGLKTLSLTKSKAFDNVVFSARSTEGETLISDFQSLHYTGIVTGEKTSLVSISVSEGEMSGIISFGRQNWNLQKDKGTDSYKLFHDDNILQDNSTFCESESNHHELEINDQNTLTKSKSSTTMSTVDVYFECDYQMFTHFGSDVDSTLNYATSLLNTVNLIYNMANINLKISQIQVWTTPDPYDANNANSASDVLNALKCELDGVYNGRIAHLLSTTNQFGGIANRRDYCPYREPLYSFSRIFRGFNSNLDVYSWSVNVIAHEIGHNLSSPHTHNCSWNGNNTQIDDCANVYSTSNNNDSDCDGVIDNIEEASGSDCFDILNPIIPPKGTIMSYCHLSSSGNGVDLSQGFHIQVANKMKHYLDHCLSSSTFIYCPMPQSADIVISSPNPNELVLTCNLVSGIDGYAWYIKPDLPCTQDTTIVTTSNTLTYTNADDRTNYIVKCLLNCDSGPEWGEWSCEKEFRTDCHVSQTLTGTVADVAKLESASDFIHSDEYIVDNSFVTYHVGNEATLSTGFEVELASTFQVYITICN